MAYGYPFPSVWVSAGIAVLGNAFVSLLSAGAHRWIDMLYFTLTALIFSWIVAPPFRQVGPVRITLPYRFILGSVAGSLLFLLVTETTQGSFRAFLKTQGEQLSSLFIASAGNDAVQRSLLEQYITPEAVAEAITLVILRGGGLVSCLGIFFISRQMGLLLARLIRRITVPEQISLFYTPPWFIWALSFSLLGAVLATLTALPLLEIGAWNMVTICSILYLAQGWGIVRHFLSRKNLSPVMRLGLNILIIFLIFSPGINVVVLGLLVLLGIAEHWAPFRAPKTDGPSSTPGM
ncbi:MAG: YybS family protein [Spirochaetaceae bacterium]|jgi:hypothetical protein|nr:YybS family protein [Spirochaetaceae bacterium]